MIRLRDIVNAGGVTVDSDVLLKYGDMPATRHVGGYVYLRPNKYDKVLLHRVIMNPLDGMDIDHIDNDPSNNRRENLRICTRTQNLLNKKLHKMMGVHFRKERNKYAAAIKVNGCKQHLGYFDTAEEAHNAYLDARRLADRLLGIVK